MAERWNGERLAALIAALVSSGAVVSDPDAARVVVSLDGWAWEQVEMVSRHAGALPRSPR